MAKIKLGSRPETFNRKLTVLLPEGDKGEIEIVYRYRTRTEFGTFVDELLASAGVKAKGTDDESVSISLRRALEQTRDANADYIMQIATGWNLDQEFSRETVAQMCDELPGVALTVIETYRQAIVEGRLGN